MKLQQISQACRAFWDDEQGLTAVEYAIAGGLVAAVAAGAFVTLGENVDTKITEISDCVAGPSGCGGGGTTTTTTP